MVLVPAAFASVPLGAAACGEVVVVVVVVLWLCCVELGCEAAADVLGELEFIPLMPLFEAAAPGLLEAPLFEQLEAIIFTLLT